MCSYRTENTALLMTQTDLSDVRSMTLLEASEAAAGLCEMTADRRTDRQTDKY